MNEVYIIDMPAQGAQGPQGPAGPQGTQGPQGSAGQIGTTGDKGDKGDQGAGYLATSATALALVGTGNVTFTTQPGLAYSVGGRIRMSSRANLSTYMEGAITAYNATSGVMTIAVGLMNGTAATYSDWNINIAGIPGTYSGAPLGSMALQNSNNVTISGGSITGIADPANPLDVANKEYVDAHAGGGGISDAPLDSKLYGRVNATWVAGVKLAGDTMTGPLTIPALAVDYAGANAVNAAWIFAQVALTADYLSATPSNKRLLTPAYVWAAAVPVAAGALTTFTPDHATGINFTWTLNNANCQLNNPANLKPGQAGLIFVAQDATGARNITAWGSGYKFPGGTKPTMTVAPNAVDIISYVATGTTAAPVVYCTFLGGFA